MRPLFALDICNTLADIVGVLERELGPHPNPSQYAFPGATKEYFQDNLWIFDQAPVIPGSVEGANLLAETGDIIYLTARPKEAHLITREWLLKNGFPQAPVIISNQKAAVARQYGVSLAVDDAPHEIDALTQVCPVMVHAKPYNEGYSGRFEWGNILKGTIDLLAGTKKSRLQVIG